MKTTTIGDGSMRIGVVGCLNGDDTISRHVVKRLMRADLQPGLRLKLLLANEEARKPGPNSAPAGRIGRTQDDLESRIREELSGYPYILDVRSTFANMEPAIIVTSGKGTKDEMLCLVNTVPFKKVLTLRATEPWSVTPIIDYPDIGVVLEFPNRWPAWQTFECVRATIQNLASGSSAGLEKEWFVISGFIGREKGDLVQMENFRLVRKGDPIIKRGHNPVHAESDFYPVFVGEQSHADRACLMALREGEPSVCPV